MSNTSDINQLSPLQRSVLALKEMRAKLDAVENAKTEPIAIIGMNCRFPGEPTTLRNSGNYSTMG